MKPTPASFRIHTQRQQANFQQIIEGAQVMATRQATIARARAEFLEGHHRSTPVRTEVLSSWLRSRANRIDCDRLRPQFSEDFSKDERLFFATAAVLESAIDGFADLDVAFLLSDTTGLIIGRWSSERRVLGWLDRVDATEGISYSEEVVGTNGIGTALETGGVITLTGEEHFVSEFHQFCCVGVPVRDRISGRIRGILNVTARCPAVGAAHYAPLIRLAAEQLVSSIEARLAAGSTHGDHVLLQRFLQARRRNQGVLAFNDRAVMSDPRATRALGEIDQSFFWKHAGEAMENGKRTSQEFATDHGDFIQAFTAPVFDGDATIGAVTKFEQGSPSRRIAEAAHPGDDALPRGVVGTSTQLRQAVRRARVVLESGALALTGAAGTGKTHIARAIAAENGFRLNVTDAASVGIDGFAGWLDDVLVTLTGDPGAIIIRHADQLGNAAADALSHPLAIARDRGWKVIATARGEIAAPLGSSLEQVRIPPLEAREDDLDLLIEHFARPARVTPEARQLLHRMHWHGNVAQLSHMLLELRAENSRALIDVACFPLENRVLALRGNLTRIERSAVREMLNALDEFDGSRQKAADSLGISRSTLYRRLRDAGIELDKTVF